MPTTILSIASIIRATGLALTVGTLVLLTATAVHAQIDHGYSNVFPLDTVTAVDDGQGPPLATALTSVYPNPSNHQTTIEFAVDEAGVVELAVFDIRGRLIRLLDYEYRAAGRYRIKWSGQDWAGNRVPAGSYFFRLLAAGEWQAAKVTLAK